jgi:quinol monooxygenase YgiN
MVLTYGTVSAISGSAASGPAGYQAPYRIDNDRILPPRSPADMLTSNRQSTLPRFGNSLNTSRKRTNTLTRCWSSSAIDLAEASRKEDGNLRFDVLQHAMRANHFTVIEEWKAAKAIETCAAATHTKEYRNSLGPILGSPLDERLYKVVE